MKCPRCSLVHPPKDLVCRRCHIDLRTGETMGRPAVAVAVGIDGKDGRLNRIKRKAADAVQSGKPESGRKKESETQPQREDRPGRDAAPKKDPVKFSLLRGAEKTKGPQKIVCVQCGNYMHVERTQPYSNRAPQALFAMGAILAAGGLFYHLLFVTAAVSIIAGIYYQRAGKYFWQCPDCGFTINRSG